MDHSPPGSSVHGISQARILEWAAISFSRESKKWTEGMWRAGGWQWKQVVREGFGEEDMSPSWKEHGVSGLGAHSAPSGSACFLSTSQDWPSISLQHSSLTKCLLKKKKPLSQVSSWMNPLLMSLPPALNPLGSSESHMI